MGLDQVEIMMDIEDAFEIPIFDDDWQRLKTVGDLHRLVQSKLQFHASTPCPCVVAFCSFRRAAIQLLGVPRSTIRLNTAMLELLPVRRRRKRWNRLQELTALQLPALQRPGLVKWVGVFFFLALAVVVWSATPIAFRGSLQFAIISLTLTVLFLVIAAVVTKPLAVCLPSTCLSVRDMVSTLVLLNYGRGPQQGAHRNEEQDWQTVRDIVSSGIGVPVNEVTREARLIDDLRCD